MTRNALIASAAFAAAALAFAYVLQHGYGLEPCHLCWWQRYPYMAILPVALAGILSRRTRAALLAVSLLLLTDAGIAWFHGGVEAGIFALPESCAAVEKAGSVEALRAQLLAAKPSCDQISWVFLGLSLSVWNAIAASLMTIVAIAALVAERLRSPRN